MVLPGCFKYAFSRASLSFQTEILDVEKVRNGDNLNGPVHVS